MLYDINWISAQIHAFMVTETSCERFAPKKKIFLVVSRRLIHCFAPEVCWYLKH